MQLRTRLILIVLVFCGLVAAGLLIGELGQRAVMREQFSQAVVRDRSLLWDKILETQIARMDDRIDLVTENDALSLAVVQGRGDRVRRLMPDVEARMRGGQIAERLEIYDMDGALLFSSLPFVFATPVVNAETIRRVMAEGRPAHGIGNDQQRRIAVAEVFPLRRGDRIVGAASYATPIARALTELGESTGSWAFLVNRRLRPLAGSVPEVWAPIAETGQVDFSRGAQILQTPERSFHAIYLPLTADLGTLVGTVVMVRDATDELAARAWPHRVSIAVTVVLLLTAGALLTWYLRRVLAPLTASVVALDALAEERIDVPLQGVDREDELGRLARAVNRYRRQLRARQRARWSRERQRFRQERFIQAQMSALAETLDSEARGQVLQDLEAIRTRGAEAAGETGGREDLTILAEAFETLAARVRGQHDRLTALVAELQEALASKAAYHALQRDLEIGRRVQTGSLPPEFPPADDVRVHGHMDPAELVGGDFYDIFTLDADRLVVVIGDVVAKGVPAALFATISRTLVRALAPHFDRPGDCLTEANRQLAANNPECLFLTMFYGVLDRGSGRLRYVTAGHPPPILVRSEGVRPLPASRGPGLALLEDAAFETVETALSAGDCLFIYTDGMADCFDPEGAHRFGDHRLPESLEAAAAVEAAGEAPDPAGVVARVVADLAAFSAGGEREDDVTCLALTWTGRSGGAAAAPSRTATETP